ncbi:TetR/AcrR family transcriptional regulator [Corynebacterium sp. S7]
MSSQNDLDSLLDAAENLFYERGYQSVGMDTLRAASGLSLKRIYSLLPSKEAIAVAMLDRRDERWMTSLAEYVSHETQPRGRVLAIFDWLSNWLGGEGHRGCAWINAFGELGGISPAVAESVRRHKTRLRNYVDALVSEVDNSPDVANGVFLLIEGCMVTAGISGNPDSANQAKNVVDKLLGHD